MNCLVIAVLALVVVRFRLRRQDVVGAVAARQDIQIDVVRVDLDRVAEVAVLDRGDRLCPDVDLDVDALLRRRILSDHSRDRAVDRAHVVGVCRPRDQCGVELVGVLPRVDLHRHSRAVRIVEVQHLGRELGDARRRGRHRIEVDAHRQVVRVDQFLRDAVEIVDADLCGRAVEERHGRRLFVCSVAVRIKVLFVRDRRPRDRPARAVRKVEDEVSRVAVISVASDRIDAHDLGVGRVDRQVDRDLTHGAREVRFDGDRDGVAVRTAARRDVVEPIRIVCQHGLDVLVKILSARELERNVCLHDVRAALISCFLSFEIRHNEARQIVAAVADVVLIRLVDHSLGDLAPVDNAARSRRIADDVAGCADRVELVVDPQLQLVVSVAPKPCVLLPVCRLDSLAVVIAGDIDVGKRAVHKVDARVDGVHHREGQQRRDNRFERLKDTVNIHQTDQTIQIQPL